jgi:hypothetical protein
LNLDRVVDGYDISGALEGLRGNDEDGTVTSNDGRSSPIASEIALRTAGFPGDRPSVISHSM